MNIRTIISTIVSVLAYCNLLLAGFDTAILDGHPTAQIIYKVLSSVFALAAWANSHWFNQDFTEEACESTGYMRLVKAQRRYHEIEGEDFGFNDEEVDDEDDDDDEEFEEEEE